MTDRSVSARTREEDQSRAARFRVGVLKWKDPIIAVVLLPTAVATIVLGFEVRGYSKDRAEDAKVVRVIAQKQAAQQRATAATAKATAIAAKINCQRSKQYGPALADYYARERVLPVEVIEAYRRTIPKTCPK